MADAISFDESFWIEEIDPTDPESLSSVFVDYTPAFNLGECFKENFEIYLKYLALLDPLEADVLVLYYYCDKKVKEIAKILKTTPVKISALIHQAEARLAIFLHVNLLYNQIVADELIRLIPIENDLYVFQTFLREISRRRTAHIVGLTFHQVSAIVKRIYETISQSEKSHELTELLKVLAPVISPTRETRQLDPSERVFIYDPISCPQQRNVITAETVTFNSDNYYQTTVSVADVSPVQAPTAYLSVCQQHIAEQLYPILHDNLWSYLAPTFINRMIGYDFLKPKPAILVKFAKTRVERHEAPVALHVIIKPSRRKRFLQKPEVIHDFPLIGG